MIRASRFRYWLPLLPLLVLLAFVYWLDQQVKQEVAAAAASLRHDPDAIMENFSSTTMNQQGQPRFLLSAKKMTHYPDHDTTELDLPDFTTLNADAPPVHMKGLHGNVSSRGDEVIFRDSVTVVRDAAGEQSAKTLRTEYLRVLPNQDRADTDKPVTLLDDNNTVHAVGLEMDNKMHLLKLLSQVRSEHLTHVK